MIAVPTFHMQYLLQCDVFTARMVHLFACGTSKHERIKSMTRVRVWAVIAPPRSISRACCHADTWPCNACHQPLSPNTMGASTCPHDAIYRTNIPTHCHYVGCCVGMCARVHAHINAEEQSLAAHAVKLTWLVLGGDPAARSHRVERFTAL